MKHILAISAIFLFNNLIYTQELVFNNYRGIEGITNPSYVASFNGDWKATLLHRQQWLKFDNKFITSMVNYEKKVKFVDESFGVSGFLIKQTSGQIGFTSLKLGTTLSYSKIINHHTLLMGFQPFINHRNIDLTNKTAPNQYDIEIGNFNPNFDNLENTLNERKSTADFNFGLGWIYNKGRISPNLGISFLNVIKPNEAFSNNTNKRLTTKVIHGAVSLQADKQNFINPYFHLFTDKANHNLMLGLDYAYMIPNDESEIKSIRTGLQANTRKHADAYVISTGIDLTRYSIDLSYENFISGIATPAGGAFELKISYEALSTDFEPSRKPCNRF